MPARFLQSIASEQPKVVRAVSGPISRADAQQGMVVLERQVGPFSSNLDQSSSIRC